ncbi:hypothetical protein HPB48_016237 [Haemaphysalis longicornis]|uniref:Immunoglobulin I-set domain-containing protein n=1 Tax=Haemaphysalis longicornis TaxID=44386 RepID=A0A9J6GFN0_HAELO|nr:hypothetical protein HPB48_016237 [Haemaphysalis longicornis]
MVLPLTRNFHFPCPKVNGTVTISCNIDTRPLPRVSWFLGDTPLTPTERITLTSGKNGVENAKLTIHRVNLQDRNRFVHVAAHFVHYSPDMHFNNTRLRLREKTMHLTEKPLFVVNT